MLVLTRKSNQSIMIGDNIEVSVLAIVGEKVRIGIQAPRDVPVFRKEVYLEIQDEHRGEAAAPDAPARTACSAFHFFRSSAALRLAPAESLTDSVSDTSAPSRKVTMRLV